MGKKNKSKFCEADNYKHETNLVDRVIEHDP